MNGEERTGEDGREGEKDSGGLERRGKERRGEDGREGRKTVVGWREEERRGERRRGEAGPPCSPRRIIKYSSVLIKQDTSGRFGGTTLEFRAECQSSGPGTAKERERERERWREREKYEER